jgi:hypothetical protein
VIICEIIVHLLVIAQTNKIYLYLIGDSYLQKLAANSAHFGNGFLNQTLPFASVSLRESSHWGDQDVDGRIILG